MKAAAEGTEVFTAEYFTACISFGLFYLVIFLPAFWPNIIKVILVLMQTFSVRSFTLHAFLLFVVSLFVESFLQWASLLWFSSFSPLISLSSDDAFFLIYSLFHLLPLLAIAHSLIPMASNSPALLSLYIKFHGLVAQAYTHVLS